MSNQYMWEYANFSPGKSIEFPEPKITTRWALNSNLKIAPQQGLLIRNVAIKTTSAVRLRSLGCQVSIKGRLVGNSCLWIFSRHENNSTQDVPAERPVCILRKLVDTQRLFCIFGQKNATKTAKSQLQGSSGLTSPQDLKKSITDGTNSFSKNL